MTLKFQESSIREFVQHAHQDLLHQSMKMLRSNALKVTAQSMDSRPTAQEIEWTMLWTDQDKSLEEGRCQEEALDDKQQEQMSKMHWRMKCFDRHIEMTENSKHIYRLMSSSRS